MLGKYKKPSGGGQFNTEPLKFVYRLDTDSATEPVTRDDMLKFIKDVQTVEYDLLDSLTKSARIQFEEIAGIALINKTYTAFSDVLPCQFLDLRFGRIDSVTTIKVFAEDSSSTTVDASNYYVAKESARVALKSGYSWPSIGQIAEGFQVQYVAGFGADATFVPEDIKTAIKQLATHYFEYREPVAFDEVPESIRFSILDIAKQKRMWNI